MSKIIQVGMADYKMATAPDKLITAGLGSCIGICLYDKIVKLGSMTHIMLPDSSQARNASNEAKFADTGIIMAIREMEKKGAQVTRIQAKIAGGAQMFKFSGQSDIMKIGERNSAAVKENLQLHRIKLLSSDTGGNYGRTIIFDPGSGDLLVKTIGHGERII